MIGFVDNSNGQTNEFMDTSESHDEILQRIQRSHRDNAQIWANPFGVIGGALELPKCSVHVATWTFTSQGAPVLHTDNDKFAMITVEDPTSGTASKLQYLSRYTAHKTLGHFKEPAGTQWRQYGELMKKSDKATAFLDLCSRT